MDSGRKTIIHRRFAVLVTLTMLGVTGCGSGTSEPPAEGALAVVETATSTTGTLPDGSPPAPAPGDTAPGGTAPGDTTSPPATTTPPTTTAPPTTTTTTAPPAEPIAVSVMEYGSWTLKTDAPDGAGGSGDHRETGPNSVGIRSYAWHGYNGRNTTTAKFDLRYNAGRELSDLSTDRALVTVSFRATGAGAIKAPWDRAGRFQANVETGIPLAADPQTRELINIVSNLATEQNTPRAFSFDQATELSFYVTADNSEIYFSLTAKCEAWSGGQTFALLNEGYCDMYEEGQLTLHYVEATFSPVD